MVLAGVFTFLTIWIVRGFLYRITPPPITDAAVDRTLERLILPIHRVVGGIANRLRGLIRRRGDEVP